MKDKYFLSKLRAAAPSLLTPMPGVSKEQVEQARRVDLLTYLLTYEPDAVKKSSANEYCLVEHDSLKISNGKWHWHSRDIGGKDALTFLVKVRGVGFVDAVRSLCGGFAAPASSLPPINLPPPKPKEPKPFALPPPFKDNIRVTAYLQGRGIDSAVIEKCIQAGTLYENKNFHNAVFVGMDTTGKPRFACVRSTVNNTRLDIESSDKRYCFSIPANNPEARFVMVAEAPIDVMSLATLRYMDAGTAGDYHYLSLGCSSPLALAQYLTDHPKIEHVIVCLDNERRTEMRGANQGNAPNGRAFEGAAYIHHQGAAARG